MLNFKTTQQGRRQFLKQSLILGTASMTSMCTNSTGMRRVQDVGLQLYTLRNEMAQDFEGTLARVAELGYREMEFAGYFGRSPAEVRRILDRFGNLLRPRCV